MSEESTGVGQRAKSLVQQAKRSVGVGGPPLATEAGGRAEGMSEAFRAFGEGDMDRFMSAFADDVEWSAPKGDGFPGAGHHQGRAAVRKAFVGDAERSYTSFGFRPDRYLETPGENLVVALGAFTGEGVKGNGQLDAPAVQTWEFDGDKVIFVGIYTDSADFPGVVTEKEQKEREQEKEGDDEDDDRDDDSS
jgi:ketosteroid isomerase-like protein